MDVHLVSSLVNMMDVHLVNMIFIGMMGLAKLFWDYSQHQSLRSTPFPAKLLKGVEENSVTQTGRLRSFRGEGTLHRKR